MIPLLRGASLVANFALFAGVPYLAGLPVAGAVAVAASCFLASWWRCGCAPAGEPASGELLAAAAEAASRMGAPPPAYVRVLPGWTAGVVRAPRRSYGVLLGDDVAAEHRVAVLAHEIAHFTTGDLAWEPFTDGPARHLLGLSRKVPPCVVIACPFALLGAPLARATELRADRLASDAVSSYPAILRQVADKMGVRGSLLYPSLASRIRHSARISK